MWFLIIVRLTSQNLKVRPTDRVESCLDSHFCLACPWLHHSYYSWCCFFFLHFSPKLMEWIHIPSFIGGVQLDITCFRHRYTTYNPKDIGWMSCKIHMIWPICPETNLSKYLGMYFLFFQLLPKAYEHIIYILWTYNHLVFFLYHEPTHRVYAEFRGVW